MSNSILTRLNRIRRQAIFQAFILGLVSFTQPGIWSTLSILGAGGLETTNTANIASAITFAVMTATSCVFAVLANTIGLKLSLLLGVLGYAPYSAGLYLNSKNGTQWLIMFGAATCGLSASIFWVVEGSAAVFYPSTERGLFIGIWQLVNKLGLIIGGSITLALNIDTSSKGSVSLNTYAAFIAIQCAGVLIVGLFVGPTEVIRKDGTIARSNVGNESIKQRFSKLRSVLLRKEVLLLAPLSLAIQWFETWQGNYMTVYFSVRARSLNTLVTAFVQMFTDILMGLLLDSTWFSQRAKLRWSWHIINILMTAFFIYGFILQGIYDKNPVSGLDWIDNGFDRGFIPFLLFKAFGEALNNWIYYLIGTMNFHSTEITYVISIVRGLEAMGEMWAFVVGAVNSNLMVNLAVSAGAYWLTVPSVTYIVHYLAEDVGAQNLERNKVLDKELDLADDLENSPGSEKLDVSEGEKNSTEIHIRDL